MRVLVTGATGFLGTHLVPLLREAGHELVLVARSVDGLPSGPGITLMGADVLDAAAMKRAAAGCQLAIHAAGHVSRRPEDAESLYRPFTDEEHKELGIKVKQFYDLFIARVAEGRKMKPEAVDAIARGKVWTGAQAREIGLVDRLGGLREALAEARRLGGLDEDAPFTESPEEDDSLLGVLLKLVGITSVGVNPMAATMIPPVFLDFARVLSPFLIFESSRPMARAELGEVESLAPSTAGEEP